MGDSSFPPLLDVAAIFCQFIAFSLVSLYISPFLIRMLDGFYNKLETYHKMPQDYNGARNEEQGEPFWQKVWKLGKYNLCITLLAVTFLLIYVSISGEFGINITSETLIGLVILIGIMHLTIRVVSFGQWEGEDIDKLKQRKKRTHEFGFSFILSIYFLVVFGIGVNVVNGNIPSEFDYGGEITQYETVKASLYTVGLFLTPYVSALFSEFILVSTLVNVPSCLKTDFNDE